MITRVKHIQVLLAKAQITAKRNHTEVTIAFQLSVLNPFKQTLGVNIKTIKTKLMSQMNEFILKAKTKV